MMPLNKILSSRISTHLLLLTVVPLLLIVLILTIHSVTDSRHLIEQQLKLRGEIIVNTTANGLELALFAGDEKQQKQQARQVLRLPDVDFIQIENEQGHLLLEMQDEADITHLRRENSNWHADGYWYFRAPIRISEVDYFDDLNQQSLMIDKQATRQAELLGWVTIGLSEHASKAQALDTLRNNLVISILGFFAAVLVWSGVSNRLNEALGQMVQTMRRIKHGDLNARASTTSSGEIRELIRGFNDMADRIQLSSEDMSRQIEQATAELNETLRQLQIRNKELDISREEAESANHAKDLFLARMSHELRTPLTSIIGFTKLVEELPEGHQRIEAISVIQTASRLLLTTIDDILSYVKLQSGSLLLEAIPFNLVTCVDDVIAMLKDTAHDKNLIFEAVIDPDIAQHYLGDQTRVAQILTNLLSNAIKFTETGSVILALRLIKNQENLALLKFTIKDTGIGIPEASLKKLFRPFAQADSSISRRYGGSGLGLQICKQLVDMMGGVIKIESEVNVGTTIHFSLQMEHVAIRTSEDDSYFDSIILRGAPSISRKALYSLLTPCAKQIRLVDNDEDLIHFLSDRNLLPELLILMYTNQPSNLDDIAAQMKNIRQRSKCPILLVSQKQVQLDKALSREFHPVYNLQSPISHQTLQNLLPSIQAGRSQYETDADKPVSNNKVATNKRVLLVEDNPLNRKFLSRFLSTRGIEAESASDGYKALEQLDRHSYDLILMDLHLPEMDGRECTRRLRASSSSNAHTPVYALTAELGAETDTTLIKDGFNGVMLKPIDETLLDSILNLQHSENHQAQLIASSMLEETQAELLRLHGLVVSDLADNQWLSARNHVHSIMGMVGLNQVTPLKPLAKQLHQACLDRDRELALVLLEEYLEILTEK